MKKVGQIIFYRENTDYILYGKLNYCYQFFTFHYSKITPGQTLALYFFSAMSL